MSGKNSRIYTAPVPKMPPGLAELMEGLVKDVLKCNPPDVYSFCANHMKKLIEIRDGPSPKRVMTLEQKVAMANKKIRERAARRRADYDKEMQLYKQSENQNNEGNENKGIDKNSDARQYIKEKIVKIPEEDLTGDKEHEIIVKKEEISESSESTKLTKIGSASTLTEITVDNNLPATSQESNKTNDIKDYSLKNVIENIDGSKTIVAMQEILTNENEKKIIEINQIDSRSDEKCLQLVETESDGKITNSTTSLLKESYHECDVFSEKVDNGANMEKHEISFNSSKEIINVLTVVDEPKIFEEKEDTAIIDLNMEETPETDQTKYSAIFTEEENSCNGANKDQNYVHIPHEQQDDTMSTIPSALPEEEEILNANDNEIQNHVNNTSMDLETAAITIQKVFRNFLFRNKTLSTDESTNVDINSLIEDKNEKDDIPVNKDRRTLGLSRIDTVLQTVNEEKSLSQSTDDSSTLSSAATVIQAHVRGFLVRNKLNLNKNSSTTSGVDSDGLSFTSMEGDNDNRKNKTILNIHIVPESGHFMSRDESVLNSIDLSMDGSPPGSANLHPLGYDRSERRKQLKREDAFQSISPPSNNSGKLSEDVDSVKEMLVNGENNKDVNALQVDTGNTDVKDILSETMFDKDDNISTLVDNLDTALEVKSLGPTESPVKHFTERPHSLPELTSDEMDVVTPFTPSEEKFSNNSNLIHSSEFHEVVLPTKVSRSDTAVVREFQNVLVYFLLWNNA